MRTAAARLAAAGDSRPRLARDPVNLPTIRNWLEALGGADEADPDMAPPAMIQVWTMPGLHGVRADDDPLGQMSAVLDQAGYTSVVATNCDQTYHRYLRPGDVLSVSSTLESISPLKKTALGEGYFFTTLQTYTDQKGEVVGEMRFRILKFKPANTPAKKEEATPAAPAAQQPPVPIDVAFFWEGVDAGELRIQRCGGCGTLRHPPRPMCPNCRSLEHDYVVSSGLGTVYSFVVHHHPPVPGRQMPFTVAVVELDEGTRIVGNVIDIDPSEVTVGLPVEVAFVANEAGRVLPQWRPRA
ncbi:MAG: bifunctional MaoC family dehydratase/OB-fold nucleic acid binding domain-containing protein [Actinobacteria bacterium]|nr:bifunctional MaoC family dehydratase/OB-fold nucleic acid binding domain-containing protein [Actinomycetota bacterium]